MFGILFFKMPQVSSASGGCVGERLNGAMLAQGLGHIKRNTTLSKI
jgi:hypothetical protein